MKIGVYIAGHNCRMFARQCIESVRGQTFSDWMAVVVDDASDDATEAVCNEAIGKGPKNSDGRILFKRNEHRRHSVFSKLDAIRYLAVQQCEILVGLDLDDRLHPNALRRIHDEHERGALATYGNWIDHHSDMGTEFRHMSPDRFEKIRELPWFMTAPNSFRAELVAKIPEEYFRWNDGRGYYETGFDGSVMFGIADLAGPSKVVGIEQAIYVYNRDRNDSVMNAWNRKHRIEVFEEQRGKPRLEIAQ